MSKPGQFQRGKSGNPGGRPKADVCLTSLLRAVLAERDPATKQQKARMVVDALISGAITGNAEALKQVFNRCDGLIPKTEAKSTMTLVDLVGEAERRALARKAERDQPDQTITLALPKPELVAPANPVPRCGFVEIPAEPEEDPWAIPD